MKGLTKKTLPLLVIAILSLTLGVSVIASAINGGWIFDFTPPDAPTSGIVEDTIVITELIGFLEVTTTVTGSGEIGTLHDVTIVIINVGTTGQSLVSGAYGIGFEPQSDPDSDEIVIMDDPIGALAPLATFSDSFTWTPLLVDDYRSFATINNLVWTP